MRETPDFKQFHFWLPPLFKDDICRESNNPHNQPRSHQNHFLSSLSAPSWFAKVSTCYHEIIKNA